jgi:hypothetical protein
LIQPTLFRIRPEWRRKTGIKNIILAGDVALDMDSADVFRGTAFFCISAVFEVKTFENSLGRSSQALDRQNLAISSEHILLMYTSHKNTLITFEMF